MRELTGSGLALGLLVTVNNAQGSLAVDIGRYRRRVKEEERKEKTQREEENKMEEREE